MKIKKTEAGQGGKKGHSNMSHWTPTEEIKSKNRKKRREINKLIIQESNELNIGEINYDK
ncbi:MAG: hypothetical protein KKD66_12555 [Proteobacteria bacterium]|nr:hypothetical protein [Pseudomonadota bacterium]